MKLIRYTQVDHAHDVRLGALAGDRVCDLEAARSLYFPSETPLPASIHALLLAGPHSMNIAHVSADYALRNPQMKSGEYSLTLPLADVQLLAPIDDPRKIICVGQNYKDHCAEQNQPLPERAILFAKFPTTITSPGAPIRLPKLSQMIDYEAELAFVIGKGGKHIRREQAMNHVAGYMCLNDVSARDIQNSDKQWVRAKSFDTFAPCGPAMVTADEIPDPHNLQIELTLNGVVMQHSNTSNLVFGVAELVSYISAVMTLEPGDIVTTGTPGGVGHWRKPPIYLQPGDIVSITIEKIGTLTNPVEKDVE